MQTTKDATVARVRMFTAKPASFELDSVSKTLMAILTNIEAERSVQFSLCGGFVRNVMLGLPYNDFDLATSNMWSFREVMQEMGVLKVANNDFDHDGVRQHDYFIDPYSLNGAQYPIHWIASNDVNGYTPDNFDFSINEFSLKSDGMVHAPTYAWRHFQKKIIRANPQIVMTSNMIMRTIRFMALTGFTPDQQTLDRMTERFQKPLDSFRILNGIKKMFEDGVADKSYEIMNEIGFRDIDDFDDIAEMFEHMNDQVKTGNYQMDGHGDYHDMDDQHPQTARARVRRVNEDMHGDFGPHNDQHHDAVEDLPF